MKTIELGTSGLRVSAVSLGCMRMAHKKPEEAGEIIRTCLKEGINHFDHADIYGGGQSEEIFAEAIQQQGIKREDILIQSKCGIRKGMYDFSREHILESVDNILKRLKTDYLDMLLLHRPDTLMQPEEVAGAFDELHISGKVRHFGVSNHNPFQMQLLQKTINQKLHVNQLQLSLMHTGIIDAGLNVNMTNDAGVVRDGAVLEYCRLNDITIQAWSPFQYGFFSGVFVDNTDFPELNEQLTQVGKTYGLSNTAVAAAWIMSHPANIQLIAGTMTPERIRQIARASDFRLTREEWYALYRAAGNKLP